LQREKERRRKVDAAEAQSEEGRHTATAEPIGDGEQVQVVAEIHPRQPQGEDAAATCVPATGKRLLTKMKNRKMSGYM